MRRFALILSGIVCIACGEVKVRIEDRTAHVPIDPQSKEVISFDDFVDSVAYVVLETTPESLLKRVDKVFMMDDRLLVADFASKSIFQFDRNGKYLRKISKRGRSEKEYLSIDAVMFDAVAKEVIVYDLMLEKIIYYSLDGTCRKVLRRFGSESGETRYIRDMERLSNGNFICCQFLHGTGEKKHRDGLWEMSPEGRFLRWLVPFDFVHPSVNPIYSFHYLDGGAIGWSPVEYEDNYMYDGKTLSKLISYEVKGPTAKDFKGVFNDQYFSQTRDKLFNARAYTVRKRNYELTYWGAATRGTYFYSLYDAAREQVKVGSLDYTMQDGSAVLPTAFYHAHVPTFKAVNANIEGVIVSYIAPELFLKKDLPASMKKTVERITAGRTENEVMNMNPVLQFLYVKANPTQVVINKPI